MHRNARSPNPGTLHGEDRSANGGGADDAANASGWPHLRGTGPSPKDVHYPERLQLQRKAILATPASPWCSAHLGTCDLVQFSRKCLVFLYDPSLW